METNIDLPKQIVPPPADSVQKQTLSTLHPDDKKRWEQIINPESVDQRTASILASLIDVKVTLFGGKSYEIAGAVVEQFGKLYLVTAEHGISGDHITGNEPLSVTIMGTKFHTGSINSWKHTPTHPNDKTEKGVAYLEVKGDILPYVKDLIAQHTLTPLAFTPERPQINERIAFVRRDQATDNQIQYAEVETSTNLQPFTSGVNPHQDGDYTFTLKDEDGQIAFCSGMSGLAVLALDTNGNITNRSYGLMVSLPINAGTDAFNSITGETIACDRRVHVRPVEGGFLNDTSGVALGHENMRASVPMEPSHIRVVNYDNGNTHARDPFSGKRTGIPQKNTSK